MRYQEKAGIIYRNLKKNYPSCSIGYRWDFKLDVEWYFLQQEKTKTRISVPKMFFESTDETELKPELEYLNLNNYNKSDQSHYIVISNSGLNVETL